MHLDRRLVYYYFISFFFSFFSFIWQVTIQIKSRAVMSALYVGTQSRSHMQPDFWTPCSRFLFSFFLFLFSFFCSPCRSCLNERSNTKAIARHLWLNGANISLRTQTHSQWETVSQYSISIFIATFLSRVHMIIQHYMSSIHLCMYIYWENVVCVAERAHGDVCGKYIYLWLLY